MVIDDGGPEASTPGPTTSNVSTFNSDPSKKSKAPIPKKVCLIFLYSSQFESSLIILMQAFEKRPEVRLLEYDQVPGISFGPELTSAQRIVNFKRAKTEHPSAASGKTFLFAFLISLSHFRFSSECGNLWQRLSRYPQALHR